MDYVSTPESDLQLIENGLIRWAEDRRELELTRDEIVRYAVAAGISKHRVHVLTGIARTTIDKITRASGSVSGSR